MQMRSVLAVHLEQPNAHGDALPEEPFGPRDCLFKGCGLSLQGDGGAIPSLAPGELVGTVDAEGVGVKRRLSAGDSFEGADRDVCRTGLRERLKRSRRNLCIGVRRSCLCTRSRAGESEERCENDSCNVHQKFEAEITGRWNSRAQLAALDC